MAAIASAPPWNAEDDLLLKAAVEAGASLEALAKGAVQFSRKFTVRELQDRWRSLLYDADVSASASARMTQFELFNPNISFKFSKFGISKVRLGGIPSKRKVESIRRQYYKMRKKLCSFNNFDLSFIGAPDADDENMNMGNELLDGSHMVGFHVENYFEFAEEDQNVVNRDPLSVGKDVATANDSSLLNNQIKDPCPSSRGLINNNREHNTADQDSVRLGHGMVEFQNCTNAGELGTAHVLQDMPLWKTMEDVPAPEMMDVSLEVKHCNAEDAMIGCGEDGDQISLPRYNVDDSHMVLGEGLPDDGINRSISIVGDDFADISDSLLNFTNEHEPLVMDVDGENVNEKSCFVIGTSPRLSSPKDGHKNDGQNVCQPENLESKPVHIVSEDVNNAEKNDKSNLLQPQPGDVTHCSIINSLSIKSVPNPHSPEFHCEMMECQLNTEDPDIPCNDDVIQPGFIESSDPASSLTTKQVRVQEIISSKNEENPAASRSASQMLGNTPTPKNSPNLPLVGCGVKPEPSDARLAPVSKQAKNALADTSQRNSVANPKFAANNVVKQEGINTPLTIRTENALLSREPGAVDSVLDLEPEANTSRLDRDDSEEEELDGDHDIPYFSDIENMILEMDLSPDGEDSRFSKKVARYHQNEDAKRKIVRLEQCARSSTQRAIASKGAFAVLYGRHLKQYIKKTEVILGRATEDNEVNIDLGEEGRANKISRRQALIKMEENGSFFLKNIGKSSIFLNGKEVATGHRVCLSSSCLIEITGMSFVFEMNYKSIKRYLENEAKNGNEKHANLECSPPRGDQ